MRIVIVIEGEGIADESSKAIDQECKKCGKKFRNSASGCPLTCIL